MKVILLTSLFVISIATNSFYSELDKSWEIFKTKFNKNYGHDEEISRRLIWERNLDSISKHNINYDLGFYSYYLKIHQYSDMTYEEFMEVNGLKRKENITDKSEYTFMCLSNVILPDKVDWRKKGYVTEVKNQGGCGSCWAFSATGALEGQHKRKTGKLVSLSEQNLVDCSRAEGNHGCDGGLPNKAFTYIKRNKGIDTEKSYPYEQYDRKCRFKRETVGATCSGYVNVTEGDEETLKQAVATIGPISVLIDATEKFFDYGGGIFDDETCSNKLDDINHAVLVVGYGTENGIDYWLVKNSWGTSWGIEGYIKMSRNKKNQCGIAILASYPLVA